MSDYLEEEEEEEEAPKPRRRGNPYFADTYSASFRALPGIHRGPQTVTEDDTIGTLDECWCGQPLDHDWPGKALGRKHPRGNTVPDTATLDRRDLRAYHSTIQEFVLHEVRVNGLRYRVNKNSLLLYPPDGTNAITVFARNNDSQLRSLSQWHAKHVEPVVSARAETVEKADVEQLAKAINDPVEHPKPEAREAVEKFDDQVHDYEARAVEPREIPTAPHRTHALSHPDRVARAAANAIPTGIDMSRVPSSYGAPRGYTWHIGSEGDVVDAIATNGKRYICVACLNTDHPWEGTRMGIGGHRRIWHSKTREAFEEAREAAKKKVPTQEVRARLVSGQKRKRELRAPVEELCRLLDYYPKDPKAKAAPKVDTTEVERLKAENSELTKKIGDLEAKLAILREALTL